MEERKITQNLDYKNVPHWKSRTWKSDISEEQHKYLGVFDDKTKNGWNKRQNQKGVI